MREKKKVIKIYFFLFFLIFFYYMRVHNSTGEKNTSQFRREQVRESPNTNKRTKKRGNETSLLIKFLLGISGEKTTRTPKKEDKIVSDKEERKERRGKKKRKNKCKNFKKPRAQFQCYLTPFSTHFQRLWKT